ncbi:rhodanese-like domain-containing protein [Fulvimarina sp. MAC3]|uniref:rhodanese-like domain-containing protein n=1 Tax=Fulvimarina sp. MAC3 TaxID=3148887 RepID=UPI0031FC5FAC
MSETEKTPSAVAAVPALPAEEALDHFSRRLRYETDCWDTHESLRQEATDFVVLDVRGPALYRQGHVPGAINLPHGKITERRMSEWDEDMLFIVYCAGPHCNGANKAAVRLSKLGRPVKEMIGGITGWLDEGFLLAKGEEPSSVTETEGGLAEAV